MTLARGQRMLMRGNEAIGQAALDAGCRAYFGYPITPQNQIPDYMAAHMPEVGGVFLQAESEVAAINMVYGAAAAGVRTMTTSSSPGISLMQEGISYIAQSEVPCVIVNIMRGGSGLGNIAPAQSDYFQAVKGGGHGDYRTLVFAAWSVQELYDLTREAFDIADRYRSPVMVLGDALLGQMMEPIVLPEEVVDPDALPPKPWATDGAKGRPRRIVNSLYIEPLDLERMNRQLQARYDEAAERARGPLRDRAPRGCKARARRLRHGRARRHQRHRASARRGNPRRSLQADKPLPVSQPRAGPGRRAGGRYPGGRDESRTARGGRSTCSGWKLPRAPVRPPRRRRADSRRGGRADRARDGGH